MNRVAGWKGGVSLPAPTIKGFGAQSITSVLYGKLYSFFPTFLRQPHRLHHLLLPLLLLQSHEVGRSELEWRKFS